MKEILELINTYWFWFVFAWIFLFLIINLINISIDYLKKKLSNEKIENNLLSHQFFTEMRHSINVRIPAIRLESKFKELVYKDFLTIQYNACYNSFITLVKRQDLDLLSKDELYQQIKELYDNMIISYKTKAIQDWIPELAVEKYMQQNMKTIEIVSLLIFDLSYSNFFYSNTSRISAMLNIINTNCLININNIKYSMDLINWDLKGLTYKGIICI